MRARLVQIGNSKGVRLPKLLLEQCDLRDEVEIEIEEDRLIIRSARPPRTGWAESFATMAARGDDSMLDAEMTSSWDESDWRW